MKKNVFESALEILKDEVISKLDLTYDRSFEEGELDAKDHQKRGDIGTRSFPSRDGQTAIQYAWDLGYVCGYNKIMQEKIT